MVPTEVWQSLEFVGQIVANDSDGVIEQRLSEHHEVEHFVHSDLLENSKNSHRVNGRYEGGKLEDVCQTETDSTDSSRPDEEEKRDDEKKDVEDGSL